MAPVTKKEIDVSEKSSESIYTKSQKSKKTTITAFLHLYIDVLMNIYFLVL